MTEYRNYKFLDVLKKAAKCGDFLIHHRRADTVGDVDEYYPADYAGKGYVLDPQLIEEGWFEEPCHVRRGDRFFFSYAGEACEDARDWWEVVPASDLKFPLTLARKGHHYTLDYVTVGGERAVYRQVDGYGPSIYAKLENGTLETWNPRALARCLATRPLPPVVGRNILSDKTLAEALKERGIPVKATEIGCLYGTFWRLEYKIAGKDRVAYEHVESGVDSYCSASVVLEEPVVQDERSYAWLHHLITGRKDSSYRINYV